MAPPKLILTTFTILAFFLLKDQAHAQSFHSPCPRLFTYDSTTNETDRWYGTITLLSETDLLDIWLRLKFDRISLQLGNWFGQVETSDSKEYHVRKSNYELKANVPQRFRFFLKYNPNEPAPRLLSFRLNGKLVCPDGTWLDTGTPSRVNSQLDTGIRDTVHVLSNTNSRDRFNNNSYDRVTSQYDTNSRDRLDSHQLSTSSHSHVNTQFDTNSRDRLDTTTTQNRFNTQSDNNFQNKVGSNTQNRVNNAQDTNSRDKFNTQLDVNSQDRLNTNSNDRVSTQFPTQSTTNSRDRVNTLPDTNSREKINTNSRDKVTTQFGTNSQDTSIVNSRDRINTQFSTQSTTNSRDRVNTQVQTNSRDKINSQSGTNSRDRVTTQFGINSQDTSSINSRDKVNTQLHISSLNNVNAPLGTSSRDRVNVQSSGSSSSQDNVNLHLNTNSRDRFATTTPRSNIIRDDICGTVLPQPRPLIAYGELTHEGEFPWHTALYQAKDTRLTYFCGASLISKSFVITAAHCVVKVRPHESLRPENLIVQLGKYNLKRFSTGFQDRQVSEIIAHPQFSAETYRNDIALLKLRTPANITDYVRPVCLWQESTDINIVLNKIGKVVGWGYDEAGKISEELMQAKMPVIPKDKCISSYPDFYTRFTSVNSYCAGFANGTSPCNGDAGGGMVFPIPDTNRYYPVWQLRGLISLLPSFQDQLLCDVTHYAIFTDVAKYLDWIDRSMN